MKDSDINAAIKKFSKIVYRKKYLLLLGLGLIVVIFIFSGFISMLFFLLLLTALNISVSYAAKHIPRLSTSIELIMMSTVLAGVAYGSKVGAFFGFISCILYYYGAGRFSFYLVVFAPLYAIIGIISGFFGEVGMSSLFSIGMGFTIGYAVVSSILVWMLFSAKVDKIIGFIIINIPFNLIIFKYAAPILLRLMQAF